MHGMWMGMEMSLFFWVVSQRGTWGGHPRECWVPPGTQSRALVHHTYSTSDPTLLMGRESRGGWPRSLDPAPTGEPQKKLSWLRVS